MHPYLIVAVKAARRAGRLITRAAADVDSLKVTRKQENDFVTEVDRASEQELTEVLLSAYPDHAVLGEESGLTMGPKAGARPKDAFQAEKLWIIDPLDGTTNFIHGLPHYSISMGLMERGVLTQALVYDPNLDELFTATKGRGAFMNDRRIRVSRRTRIQESLIGTGFPYRKLDELDRYLGMMKNVIQHTAGLRRPGSAALDLAYVAAGRYDGFFELGLAPWDIAAGALLVSEAGGIVGDFDGEQNHLQSGDVVAGTPKVFAALLPLLGRPSSAPAPGG